MILLLVLWVRRRVSQVAEVVGPAPVYRPQRHPCGVCGGRGCGFCGLSGWS